MIVTIGTNDTLASPGAQLDYYQAVLDRIERLAKPTQHVHRDRVHDLLMVELENGDRAVEIERDVLELHCFLMTCVYALFRYAEDRT